MTGDFWKDWMILSYHNLTNFAHPSSALPDVTTADMCISYVFICEPLL